MSHIWQDNLVILFIFLCAWTQSKYRQQPHSFKYTSVTDSPGLLHAKFSNMIANEVGSLNVNQKICFSKCSERGWREKENSLPKAKCIKKKASITEFCLCLVRSCFIISRKIFNIIFQFNLFKNKKQNRLNSVRMIGSSYQVFLHETKPQKIWCCSCGSSFAQYGLLLRPPE